LNHCGEFGAPHLGGQHVAHLVVPGAGVVLGIEMPALPAPVGPGAGQAIEHRLGRAFAAHAQFRIQLGQCGLIALMAPQPGRHGFFLDRLQHGRHAGAAEIFLGQHVDGDLRPGAGHLDVIHAEDHRAVGIANLARHRVELQPRIGALVGFGVPAFNAHSLCIPQNQRTTTPASRDGRLLPLDLTLCTQPRCRGYEPLWKRLPVALPTVRPDSQSRYPGGAAQPVKNCRLASSRSMPAPRAGTQAVVVVARQAA
jgi:hypothetical protein